MSCEPAGLRFVAGFPIRSEKVQRKKQKRKSADADFLWGEIGSYFRCENYVESNIGDIIRAIGLIQCMAEISRICVTLSRPWGAARRAILVGCCIE
jgi:hypothetical protein